jgi:hypothetical protein
MTEPVSLRICGTGLHFVTDGPDRRKFALGVPKVCFGSAFIASGRWLCPQVLKKQATITRLSRHPAC